MRTRAAAPPHWTTLALTAASMLAFAANLLLCRLALAGGSIDPASFGAIRIVSGALALALMVRLRPGTGSGGDWISAAMLFAYVAFFSLAYAGLAAGTGALILFGAVQLTMFGWALRDGERFTAPAWCGLGRVFAAWERVRRPAARHRRQFYARGAAGAGAVAGVCRRRPC